MTNVAAEDNQKIDFVALWKVLWGKRRAVIKWGLIGAVAGLIIGFSIPREFSTQIIMAPESAKNYQMGGGMSDLAALAGINLSSTPGVDGINLTIYPDIVKSTPFLIRLSQIPLPESDKAENSYIPLYDYIDELSSPWWTYLLRLPMKFLGLFGKKEENLSKEIDPFRLTGNQSAIIQGLSSRISVEVDKKTNVIKASATMQDKIVSAIVADSLTSMLQEYVIDYRTNKAKIDQDFAQQMYEEAQQEYYAKQRVYAEYVDITQNAAKQTVRIEQERLRNEQQLAYSVYSQMAQQLELAKMKVQEQTPTVTIIEPATVPLRRSNTSKLTLLIIFTFLGVLGTTGVIIVKELLNDQPA